MTQPLGGKEDAGYRNRIIGPYGVARNTSINRDLKHSVIFSPKELFYAACH
jgi:hypothetical protein